MTFQPEFTITSTIARALTRIERARGFLEAAALSEDWVRRMGEEALVREAHHTTHIEGTRLTLEESERLWHGGELPGADADDARELLNYRAAFDLVTEHLAGGGPITESLVREIHRRLVEGVRGGAADPGRYRRVQNYVVNSVTREVIYEPPPAIEVPILMGELVEWLNAETDVHPVLISGLAQYQLVHIHPFLDGNGRVSRLLSMLCLYGEGYDFKRLFTISEYYDRDRQAFYRALQEVRASGMDLTGWLEYFTGGLAAQLSEVRERGALAIRADVLAREYGLSERQMRALHLVLAAGRLTIADYEADSPGTSRRTLQRDLGRLVEEELLAERGSGPTDPTRHYVPGPVLER